jgi:hypothetical protein
VSLSTSDIALSTSDIFRFSLDASCPFYRPSPRVMVTSGRRQTSHRCRRGAELELPRQRGERQPPQVDLALQYQSAELRVEAKVQHHDGHHLVERLLLRQLRL